jgi:glycosyltransferase involved in cell wall biosynthesis
VICFYCISTQLGGAERSLLEFLLAWVKSGDAELKPWVIVPSETGPLVDALKEAGIEVTVLPMPAGLFQLSRLTPVRSVFLAMSGVWGFPGYFVSLIDLLRERKPALLHTTGIKCHWIGALAARGLGIPVLWHLRDILAPGATRSLLRWTSGIGEVHLICNSRATLEAMDLPGKVIYNGLSGERYRSDRDESLRKEFAVPAGAPIVGILGVLARWKGQVEFMRMAAELVRSGSNAHFMIVGSRIYDTAGDRDYEEELRRMVRELGLEGRVHFAGFRKDAVRVLNGLDVLVHASIRPEPFGRVVLEAMACEVPVVATRGGGIDEFVEEGKTGKLVSPGDVTEMAQAVRTLLSEPELRSRIVSNAKASFSASFTMERHLAAIRKTYSEVLFQREV